MAQGVTRSVFESRGVTGGLLGRLGDWLDALPVWAVLLASVVLELVVAAADYATGGQISLTIFYLGPVVLVTWLVSEWAGVGLALLSVLLWTVANLGQAYANPLVPVWNSLVNFGFFVVTIFLVSLARWAIGAERAASRTDALSGVANSRAFHDRADLALAEMRRSQRPLTFVYADLDHFKNVNDSLGHVQGDEVLRVVASALAERVRATDFVARIGGDEFGILLPETDAGAAKRVLADLRMAVTDSVHGRWPVDISAGAVTFLSAPKHVDDMLRIADERLYDAKHSGRARTEHAVWPAPELRADSSPAATLGE